MRDKSQEAVNEIQSQVSCDLKQSTTDQLQKLQRVQQPHPKSHHAKLSSPLAMYATSEQTVDVEVEDKVGLEIQKTASLISQGSFEDSSHLARNRVVRKRAGTVGGNRPLIQLFDNPQSQPNLFFNDGKSQAQNVLGDTQKSSPPPDHKAYYDDSIGNLSKKSDQNEKQSINDASSRLLSIKLNDYGSGSSIVSSQASIQSYNHDDHELRSPRSSSQKYDDISFADMIDMVFNTQADLKEIVDHTKTPEDEYEAQDKVFSISSSNSDVEHNSQSLLKETIKTIEAPKKALDRWPKFFVPENIQYQVLAMLPQSIVQLLDIQYTSDKSKTYFCDKDTFYPHLKYSDPVKKAKRMCLNQIVESLIADSGPSDINFVNDIFLTSSYVSDTLDLARLIVLFYLEATQRYLNCKDQKFYIIQQQSLVVIKLWVDNYQEIIRKNKQALLLLQQFIDFESTKYTSANDIILRSLLDAVQKSLQSLSTLDSIYIDFSSANKAIVAQQLKQANFVPTFTSILTQDVELIAQELTHIEIENLQHIKINELFQQSWSHKDKTYRELIAPNLLFFINWFNRIAFGVATQVVKQRKLKDRVEVLKALIKIAFECLKLKNFNACFEIVAGLNVGAVSRMKQTWRALPKKFQDAWTKISSVVSNEGNYKLYRQNLGNLGQQSCVPYLGMYLSDLTFIEDGNSAFFQDDIVCVGADVVPVINVPRLLMISNVLKSIQSHQKSQYNIQSNPVVRNYLLNQWLVLSEKELYEESKLSEQKELSRDQSPLSTLKRPSSQSSSTQNSPVIPPKVDHSQQKPSSNSTSSVMSSFNNLKTRVRSISLSGGARPNVNDLKQ